MIFIWLLGIHYLNYTVFCEGSDFVGWFNVFLSKKVPILKGEPFMRVRFYYGLKKLYERKQLCSNYNMTKRNFCFITVIMLKFSHGMVEYMRVFDLVQ